MTESHFQDGVQVAWDATSIDLAEQCLYKYKLVMIDGWRSRAESHHITFGAAYATAHEHYFKYLAEGMDPELALGRVVAEALEETWEYPSCETCAGSGEIDQTPVRCPDCNGTGRGEGGKPWESFDSRKTRENLIRSIIWYFDFFKDDPVKVLTLSNGKAAVELSYAVEVDNGIIFTGHLDSLVEYQGQTFVMDQKTTGQTIGPYYWDQFNPHTQFSMYAFAGQVIFATPVKGVLIDAAQIAVGFTRFERQPTFRTQAQLDEWYRDTLYWIARAQDATRANYFPLNPAGCSRYGGCQFRGVCSKSPDLRLQFLKADFEPGHVWNPLEKR